MSKGAVPHVNVAAVCGNIGILAACSLMAIKLFVISSATCRW